MSTINPTDIDEYIAGFPSDVQERLRKIRATIHDAAPGIEEKISYKMPTFTYKGRDIMGVAAWKHHIALYAAPNGVPEFKKDLEMYGREKSTLGFPNDKPLPYDLIRRLVKFRMKEVAMKSGGGK